MARPYDSPMITKQSLALSKLVVICLLLWLVGVATSHTFGGFIHLPLMVAVVAVILRVVQGRSPQRE
jgi:hypothetical protein